MKPASYLAAVVFASFMAGSFVADAAPAAQPASGRTWEVGTPIVTYFAGPDMTDAAARQMADGGFNVVWCHEKDLDLLQNHGLRGMLHDGLVAPASIDAPEQLKKLDALIERVRSHPAFYSYFITDEPGAGAFPAFGKLVAHLREQDPRHEQYAGKRENCVGARRCAPGMAGCVDLFFWEARRKPPGWCCHVICTGWEAAD